ncbi:MAG: signal recognition particle receptor subunit alpha, partial [Clostridia bacterium]|nr:signal recognition particle receptor subunit alpha [Clostridia bacterium]
MGFFKKISDGLKKTRDSFMGALGSVINSFTKIDEELFEELEEILIMSDIGVSTAQKICAELRVRAKRDGVTDPQLIKGIIKNIVSETVSGDVELKLNTKPSVIIVIGVNGAGKTTTIGKMALQLKNQGKSVILGAADTFRAAAIDQLGVWAERAGVPMISNAEGSDPASVVFDTISTAKARG